MDPLLLPLQQATEPGQQDRLAGELAFTRAAPWVRYILRQQLGFQINAAGFDPWEQNAADLNQDILSKILQVLHERLAAGTLPEIENFRQYVMRTATNACHDHQRRQAPLRARFKNMLRHLMTQHISFALWRAENATLCGFTAWRDTSKSLWAVRRLAELRDQPDAGQVLNLEPGLLRQENLSQVVGAALEYCGGPVTLDELVTALTALLQLHDLVPESVDDVAARWGEKLTEPGPPVDSRLAEQELFRHLWQAVCQLPALQRDAFCFNFADDSGENLLNLWMSKGGLTFDELAYGLERHAEELAQLHQRLPLNSVELAGLLQATRPQVNKWRFLAVEKLRRSMFPEKPEK